VVVPVATLAMEETVEVMLRVVQLYLLDAVALVVAVEEVAVVVKVAVHLLMLVVEVVLEFLDRDVVVPVEPMDKMVKEVLVVILVKPTQQQQEVKRPDLVRVQVDFKTMAHPVQCELFGLVVLELSQIQM
jgi:hypothetical protein